MARPDPPLGPTGAKRAAASAVVVPIHCESCGVAKRTATGQLCYVAIEWLVAYKKGRRMLCPDCFAGDQAMGQLDEMVNGWEDA